MRSTKTPYKVKTLTLKNPNPTNTPGGSRSWWDDWRSLREAVQRSRWSRPSCRALCPALRRT